jgi:hypothetical protein
LSLRSPFFDELLSSHGEQVRLEVGLELRHFVPPVVWTALFYFNR